MAHPVYNPLTFLSFHRPKLRLPQDAPIPKLKPESKQCIKTLAAYMPSPHNKVNRYPREKRAAVLVALFVGRMGDLYVLLSRRASTLRSYAGDTSLPGGKVDVDDRNIEDTARREAFEEIGLPQDKNKAPLLCVLEPFMAGNGVLVTPVVVLILDNTLRPIINTPEVTQLFSHPLASFLSTNAPFPLDPETAQLPYHTHLDFPYNDNPPGVIRLHRFLTGREAGGIKPIFGLTSSILIRVAQIGYQRNPDFQIEAANQPSILERAIHTMRNREDVREAAIGEGIDPERLKVPIRKGREKKKNSNWLKAML